jgi:hypothetical protein
MIYYWGGLLYCSGGRTGKFLVGLIAPDGKEVKITITLVKDEVIAPPVPVTEDPVNPRSAIPGIVSRISGKIADGSGVTSILRDLSDGITPKAAGASQAAGWALLNLLFALLGVVFMAGSVVLRRRKEYIGDEEYELKGRSPVWLIVSAVLAAAGVILFVLTENITTTMNLVDEYTIVHAVLFAAVAVITLICLKARTETEEDEANEESAFAVYK